MMILKASFKIYPLVYRVLFTLYFILSFYIVFLARRRHNLDPEFVRQLLNISPGRDKIEYFTSVIAHSPVERYNFYTDFVGNVFLFLPLPFFLNRLFNVNAAVKLLAFAFCCSLSIEILQYVLGVGVADIDDLILNTTGAFLGTIAVPRKNKEIINP